jgi:hypothetical protein
MEKTAVRSVEDMRGFAQALFETADNCLRDLANADDIIAKVEAYIQDHFRENINREDVAAVAYITPITCPNSSGTRRA